MQVVLVADSLVALESDGCRCECPQNCGTEEPFFLCFLAAASFYADVDYAIGHGPVSVRACIQPITFNMTILSLVGKQNTRI